MSSEVSDWINDDPDLATRSELESLVSQGESAAIAERFAGRLRFGTAGLRGPLRAGPAGMNRAVVGRAATGLAAWLTERQAGGPVVIGYDARHGSERFAIDSAELVAGAGFDALLLPGPLPTPVLAFAVRRLSASAGVMVTASHNPPEDNGYKVYLGADMADGPAGDGAQIVPPADEEIEAAIGRVTRLRDQPRADTWHRLGPDIVEQYVDAVVATIDGDSPRDLTIAYTPLHGVGRDVFLDVFTRAGFASPAVVSAQAEPDPDFPTVAFPNPEEPGALDLALELGRRTNADIVIANDPDADRCAVACGDRLLTGDELGTLLADHLLRTDVGGRFATTIVSSSLLAAMCADRGVAYDETFTGFKWIVRAGADLVFGYEEAIGYCVAPSIVRDKDGISAALLVAELAARLKANGQTLLDRLDEISTRYGVHVTGQLSIRVDDLSLIADMMRRLRADPPETLLGLPITSFDDLMPATDAVRLRAKDIRVVVRPSGTEPKLKAYLEVVVPVDRGTARAARTTGMERLHHLRHDMSAMLDS